MSFAPRNDGPGGGGVAVGDAPPGGTPGIAGPIGVPGGSGAGGPGGGVMGGGMPGIPGMGTGGCFDPGPDLGTVLGNLGQQALQNLATAALGQLLAVKDSDPMVLAIGKHLASQFGKDVLDALKNPNEFLKTLDLLINGIRSKAKIPFGCANPRTTIGTVLLKGGTIPATRFDDWVEMTKEKDAGPFVDGNPSILLNELPAVGECHIAIGETKKTIAGPEIVDSSVLMGGASILPAAEKLPAESTTSAESAGSSGSGASGEPKGSSKPGSCSKGEPVSEPHGSGGTASGSPSSPESSSSQSASGTAANPSPTPSNNSAAGADASTTPSPPTTTTSTSPPTSTTTSTSSTASTSTSTTTSTPPRGVLDGIADVFDEKTTGFGESLDGAAESVKEALRNPRETLTQALEGTVSAMETGAGMADAVDEQAAEFGKDPVGYTSEVASNVKDAVGSELNRLFVEELPEGIENLKKAWNSEERSYNVTRWVALGAVKIVDEVLLRRIDNAKDAISAWRKKGRRKGKGDDFGRDETGKVHGDGKGNSDTDLPDRVPDDWSRQDMENAASELEESIRTRKLEQLRLGEDGPHRERIRQEEAFLQQLRHRLGNMK